LHGNGERELDFARGGLINSAYFHPSIASQQCDADGR